nr:MAG TPA: hypothetical protein [Crassvirales sp.]
MDRTNKYYIILGNEARLSRKVLEHLKQKESF